MKKNFIGCRVQHNLLALIFGLAATQSFSATFRYDFKDFLVGTAEYEKGPTGCTVFRFPKGAIGAIDVRGGAAGLRESASLEEENSWGWVDALVFAGGSIYGLEAASGVAREILKERKSVGFDSIPAIPSAIVYDFGGRENFLYPDIDLGAEAYRKARNNAVEVGAFGAGTNVSVGKFLSLKFAEKSGQGAAFKITNGIRFFALSVVNSLGNILNRKGEIIAGSLDHKTGQRMLFDPDAKNSKNMRSEKSGNTTISVLIIDAPLDRGELRRVAVAAHTAMARIIVPFHTSSDGDTLFVLSTKTNPAKEKKAELSLDQISMVGAELLQDAVFNAIESVR